MAPGGQPASATTRSTPSSAASRIASRKIRVVLARNRLLGVERIAPYVERTDPQSARADLALPSLARRRVREHAPCIAVAGRRVAAGADLEVADRRRGPDQPVHDVDEWSIRECFGHQAEPWCVSRGPLWVPSHVCVAIASLSTRAHSSIAA